MSKNRGNLVEDIASPYLFRIAKSLANKKEEKNLVRKTEKM